MHHLNNVNFRCRGNFGGQVVFYPCQRVVWSFCRFLSSDRFGVVTDHFGQLRFAAQGFWETLSNSTIKKAAVKQSKLQTLACAHKIKNESRKHSQHNLPSGAGTETCPPLTAILQHPIDSLQRQHLPGQIKQQAAESTLSWCLSCALLLFVVL